MERRAVEGLGFFQYMLQVKLKWAALAVHGLHCLVLIFRSLILNFKCLRAALCSNAGGSQRQEREQKKIRHTFLLPETEILHCMEMIR